MLKQIKLNYWIKSRIFLLLLLCLCREPDVPAWSPLLYQLQLLDVRDKPDRSTLSVADRIRLGSRKRERGNFHFQREDYVSAARAYGQALEVLTLAVSGTVWIHVFFVVKVFFKSSQRHIKNWPKQNRMMTNMTWRRLKVSLEIHKKYYLIINK